MLSVVKLLLKGENGVCALSSNEIILLLMENHGVFLNFCGIHDWFKTKEDPPLHK